MRRGLRSPLRLLARQRARAPERLLIAPQDIRTSDPTIAADIYAGYFAFGGKIVNAHGRSPFEIAPHSPAWERALASFDWLRHLRAADTALARANARVLVDDFLTLAGKPRAVPAWEAGVVARRLLSWLSQSPIILEGADRAFYRRFMRGLARAQITLEGEIAGGLTGESRLLVAVALAALGLSAQGADALQRRSTKLLGEELKAQILPDGGHISRNPQSLIAALLDLLPLRQAYAARGLAPPQELLNAIDRMMPMLRMLRHGDGPVALFNGMGVTAPEVLATILAYDDTRARPLVNAPHSGYQRLEMGERASILIVDAGTPPPALFSTRAHAGCLAFEFSAQSQRLIVNCGAPEPGRTALREAARTTAAHTTLIVNDTSSCSFAAQAGLKRWLGDQIIAGPKRIDIERHDARDAITLKLAHDGYAAPFGVLHKRRLVLSHSGFQLDGEDELAAAGDGPKARPYTLRFHVDPTVRLRRAHDGRAVLLTTPDKQLWLFEAESMALDVEESVLFAAPDGPRSCEQIVLHADSGATPRIRWRLRRVEAERSI